MQLAGCGAQAHALVLSTTTDATPVRGLGAPALAQKLAGSLALGRGAPCAVDETRSSGAAPPGGDETRKATLGGAGCGSVKL